MNLTDETIQDLILLIWKERKKRDLLNIILNSGEYRKCIDKYNDWKERKSIDLLDSILNSNEYRISIDKYNDWKLRLLLFKK